MFSCLQNVVRSVVSGYYSMHESKVCFCCSCWQCVGVVHTLSRTLCSLRSSIKIFAARMGPTVWLGIEHAGVGQDGFGVSFGTWVFFSRWTGTKKSTKKTSALNFSAGPITVQSAFPYFPMHRIPNSTPVPFQVPRSSKGDAEGSPQTEQPCRVDMACLLIAPSTRYSRHWHLYVHPWAERMIDS